MLMIPEEKVRAIHDVDSLLSFLGENLGWPLPPDPLLEEVTFEWAKEELNLSDDAACRLDGGVVWQVRPFRPDPPLGIFLVKFTRRVSVNTLRSLLRHLVSKRRHPSLPQWEVEDLLFICTTGEKSFSFAHFRTKKLRPDEKPTPPRLITFGWEPQEPIRTICEFNLPALHYEPDWDNETWLKEWQSAFNVEKVTEKFFEGFKKMFNHLQEILHNQAQFQSKEEQSTRVWAHDYALQFLSRLMFLYFVQRKKWLGENSRFLCYFWSAYKGSGQSKNTFFENWVKVLFFESFNNRYQNRNEYLKRFPKDIHEALMKAPYLNGGLFKPNELDQRFSFDIPDEFFELVFDFDCFEGTAPGFFERYNFTISETTPLDQEVAVDPEMIGKIYESLVNITFEGIPEEDQQGQAGIFYTPRVEIDLMCRLSLVDYLANHLGEQYKSLLYQTVFAYDLKDKEEADRALAHENLWPPLNDLLHNVTVLDPACGSGSFLVGMLSVLDDLLARAEKELGEDRSQFQRRSDIIVRSLYGVDVMPWAVHTAELRLWLQLIIETEFEWWEMKAKPMLPNLSFKVRPGDSLVQEIGGIDLGLHHVHLDILSHLKGRLTQFKGEKLKFYSNDPRAKFKHEELLKQEELDIFRQILDVKAQGLENKVKSLTRHIEYPEPQISLPGMEQRPLQAPLEVEKWRKERGEVEEELLRIQKAREALRTPQAVPFIWDIAFVEIFEDEKKGFDIVIGNPPYVRQEKIEDPRSLLEKIAYDKAIYKAKLQKSACSAYPHFFGYSPRTEIPSRKIDGRCDYYVFFYLHGLSLLNEKGSFCFITSNSWLDVGYGKDLQELLLKHCHIKLILDNERKRSFARSDVNTIIALFSSPDERSEWGLLQKARFVMFKTPFEEVLSPVIFQEIEEADKLSTDPKHRQLQVPVFGTNKTLTITELSRPEFRVRVVEQADLYKDGLSIAGGEKNIVLAQPAYTGNKWGGKYLRAPEIFWTILEKGKGMLVRLGDIAEVRFGIKTGANDFFYLEPTGKPSPKGLVHVKNGAGWEGLIEEEFLAPFLFSLKEVKRYSVDPTALKRLVFRCSQTQTALRRGRKEYVSKYITWGESLGLHNRPSVCGRELWYALPTQTEPHFISNRFIGSRFGFPWLSGILVCDVFFVGRFIQSDGKPCVALLNSTASFLIAEVLARKTYGIGVAYFYGPEVKGLLFLNPSILAPSPRQRLKKAFDEMAKREIKSIFEELGLPKPKRDYSNIHPEDISLNKVLPDRQELDSVVFEALELTEKEQLEVYRAVVELVKNRLVKARSI
jgi:hypothetical protein